MKIAQVFATVPRPLSPRSLLAYASSPAYTSPALAMVTNKPPDLQPSESGFLFSTKNEGRRPLLVENNGLLFRCLF